MNQLLAREILVTSVMALLLRAQPSLISGSNATEPYSAGKHMVT